MREENQFAQTLLRLLRKRGVTVRIERVDSGTPTLHVRPRTLVSPFLRQAIPRVKEQLIALLESEGRGSCTAANGVVWWQELRRCPQCDACDWGVIGQIDIHGQETNVWACQTCRSTVEDLETRLGSIEALRWGKADTKQVHSH